MKKWIISTLLVLSILLTLFKTYQYYITNPTCFKVQQCFFTHGENFTDTRLNVIACVTDYDTDKLMLNIKRYYDMIYGEADRLHITLFHCEADFLNYNECAQTTFYKKSQNNVFLSN